jgi:hypothetical protein
VKPERALKIIRGGRERLAEAVRAARKEAAKIERDKRFTEEARGAAVKARLDELNEECAAIREETQDALAEIRAAAPKPGKLDPLEAGRIWRRLEKRLDAGQSPQMIADGLVGAGDREALQVLEEEMPDYMRATGHDERLITGESGAIRALVMARAATDDERSHAEILAHAERSAQSVDLNVGLIESDGLETERIWGDETAVDKRGKKHLANNIDLQEAI